MSLVTVSNGHAMTSPAKTEGGGSDMLSQAVQEITKTENKPPMVSGARSGEGVCCGQGSVNVTLFGTT